MVCLCLTRRLPFEIALLQSVIPRASLDTRAAEIVDEFSDTPLRRLGSLLAASGDVCDLHLLRRLVVARSLKTQALSWESSLWTPSRGFAPGSDSGNQGEIPPLDGCEQDPNQLCADRQSERKYSAARIVGSSVYST